MNIYFAGSIRGGREDAGIYAQIIQLLKGYGTVLTEHLGNSDLTALGENRDVQEIYNRDMDLLEQADVVVAEVTSRSLGVGFELGTARLLGKRVLCLYRPVVTPHLSAMLLGSPWFTIKTYTSITDLPAIITEFLNTTGERSLPSQEFFRTVPRVHMATGMFIRNSKGDILLVKTAYSNVWQMPGGTVEQNEPPHVGVERETMEEVGLSLKSKQLLVVEWRQANGINPPILVFTFDGGVINAEQVASIALPPHELSEYKFVSVAETSALMRPMSAEKIPYILKALEQKIPIYLLNGVPYEF